MQSQAKTVDAYLRELDPERRQTLQAVREVILRNLDKDYEEGMQYGMIGYFVPKTIYPAGYHCNPDQPLPFACLAAQKNYNSFYFMGLYFNSTPDSLSPLGEWFQREWAKTGKKLDMGKSCIRFKSADDLALPVIGAAIRKLPARTYIRDYEQLIASSGSRKKSVKSTAAKSTAAKKPAAKKPAATKSAAKSAAKKLAKSAAGKKGGPASGESPKAIARKSAGQAQKKGATKRSSP